MSDKRKLPDHFPYEDELDGCRGIMIGVVIATVFWAAVVAVLHLFT